MKSLTKEKFENLCAQASEVRELFGISTFNGCFNPPSEFQKELVKKNHRAITHSGIIYSCFCIFLGYVSLALFSLPFHTWNDMSLKGMRSFTDVLAFLVWFVILYALGFGFVFIFWNRFISSDERYMRKCLKNGNFTVQECTPIGYANYGTRASSTNPAGDNRLFVVLKDDNGKIYVFEDSYIAFTKNVTKTKNTFLIKVDNIGKKKETEIFVICY